MKESALNCRAFLCDKSLLFPQSSPFLNTLLWIAFELHIAVHTVVCSSWRDKDLILSGAEQNIVDQLKIHLEQTGGGQSVSFISRICAVGALCYFRRQKRCGKWQKLGDCEVVALTSWTSTS